MCCFRITIYLEMHITEFRDYQDIVLLYQTFLNVLTNELVGSNRARHQITTTKLFLFLCTYHLEGI